MKVLNILTIIFLMASSAFGFGAYLALIPDTDDNYKMLVFRIWISVAIALTALFIWKICQYEKILY